jgi:hypothetical protein
MNQSFLMFLATENASQATLNSPPASVGPVKPLMQSRKTLSFLIRVAGDSLGLGALLAGCWFSIQLMQVFMVY